ncbi:3-keto-5-aminohexanoate cleavage protein [Labrenzia sp. 011]|uniref:3-keto-5-aminohexanoate cleavage protein n=1 Tax=Labrenzia sp. 011 TaxID=2171494 RepID=UPI000D52093D|nr:3-keto-5-aminohexanoate cleavage protein [Labrenzia sp. 011]PVB61428.1 class III aminotransferase [Labrenzia sp. 011]
MTASRPPAEVSIAVAPNGGRKTRSDHPAIPMTAAELAATAEACLDAGAAMIHVHVRKADGGHLLDADAYRAAIDAIRSAVGDRLLIQITSEALGLYSPQEQIAVVRDTRPEAVSLAYRELVPGPDHLPAFLDLLGWMKRENVLPQIILYEPAEALELARLRERGDLPFADIPVLYVLGRYTASQTSAPADLLPYLDTGQPRFAHWTVCAFGRYETACLTAAGLFGGNVRTGFENNTTRPDGSQAAGNQDLVASIAASLQACGIGHTDAATLRTAIRRTLG